MLEQWRWYWLIYKCCQWLTLIKIYNLYINEPFGVVGSLLASLTDLHQDCFDIVHLQQTLCASPPSHGCNQFLEQNVKNTVAHKEYTHCRKKWVPNGFEHHCSHAVVQEPPPLWKSLAANSKARQIRPTDILLCWEFLLPVAHLENRVTF